MFNTCLNRVCAQAGRISFNNTARTGLIRSLRQTSMSSGFKKSSSTFLNFGLGALGFGCLAAGAFALAPETASVFLSYKIVIVPW